MSDNTIFNFHGLARALADQDFEVLRGRWQDSLARVGRFRFTNLPVEIALKILKLAATKSSTYSTLMRTSRGVADLARVECVPEVLILSSPDAAVSFYGCISMHPEVGAGIKHLWLFPALATSQTTSICPAILKACYNVERLACVPDRLLEICSGTEFRHTSLVDVTLVDPIVPWERLFASRHGAAFFNQIQELRLVGGTQHTAPPLGRSFRNLTDLTLSSTTTTSVRNYILDHVRFPNLGRITVTVPYAAWRTVGMSFLMSDPELVDHRLCVVHCPKKWKELDVWKDVKYTIWNLGATEWNARATSNNVTAPALRLVFILSCSIIN
ncbi:hypothetical protein B0H14DRAFT_3608076 [Mycena olivaceomarginata]|nr:hypothetical protein B0H14DRAFT_3608076 [Mycena olivaceomarginata]